MNVKLIHVDVKNWRNDRCSRKVRSQSKIGHLPDSYMTCRKTARYEVDGINFCYQHAGEGLLLKELDK